MKKRLLAVVLTCIFVISMIVGCGKEEKKEVDNDSKDGLKICFVVTGQLGDKSFNDSANEGVTRIAETLGCSTKVIEIGRDQTKWQPTFEDLAEGGEYDIIITNGSNAGELIQNLSGDYPEQKFILFDTEIEGDYPNVYSISYKQNEGSYLAGILAAMVTTSDMEGVNPDKKIGFIGGSEHPIITDFLVGYIEGAKSVDEDIKVYVSYIGSWDDTAKGKETAIAQFNQGVDITFPAAEQAGLGCVEAAVEMNKYIIGVDSDQAMLFDESGPEKANVILTSVLKEVGNSLVRAIEMEQAGTLEWGTFEKLGLKENGAGIADNKYYQKNVPDEIKTAVEAGREEVMAGNIVVTSALSDEEAKVQKIIDSVAP
ncbi:basic membrane protein A [Lachnospiraceae bacterium PF1-22]|uniref:BMP family ABC transporter substrate-binding protein n=1 Tax=Ohessyouella blattaphilus TaxID=2949333 RepID=UPI003E2B2155